MCTFKNTSDTKPQRLEERDASLDLLLPAEELLWLPHPLQLLLKANRGQLFIWAPANEQRGPEAPSA